MNGFCYLYPEATREMPQSWRGLKGWSGVSITFEGQPVGLETLVCMECALRANDSKDAQEAADCIPLAVDGYLREQDLFQLRVEDVIFTSLSPGGTEAATLLLGRGKRGERCKSGRDQGVVLDEPYSRDILRRRVNALSPSCKVFNITADKYRKWWVWASKSVTGDPLAAHSPHAARHTGASRDLTEGYRSLEQVMKRGRWKALNSVHRYAKPHAWYEAKSKQSELVKQQGAAILGSRLSRPSLSV